MTDKFKGDICWFLALLGRELCCWAGWISGSLTAPSGPACCCTGRATSSPVCWWLLASDGEIRGEDPPGIKSTKSTKFDKNLSPYPVKIPEKGGSDRPEPGFSGLQNLPQRRNKGETRRGISRTYFTKKSCLVIIRTAFSQMRFSKAPADRFYSADLTGFLSVWKFFANCEESESSERSQVGTGSLRF